MTKGHLWKPPLAEDLTSLRAGRALYPHSAAAEAWDVAMRTLTRNPVVDPAR